MIELKMWNKDRPHFPQIVEKPDAQTAGLFLSGAIQVAVEEGGTLVVEVTERSSK
jgi:hypothetical protein